MGVLAARLSRHTRFFTLVLADDTPAQIDVECGFGSIIFFTTGAPVDIATTMPNESGGVTTFEGPTIPRNNGLRVQLRPQEPHQRFFIKGPVAGTTVYIFPEFPQWPTKIEDYVKELLGYTKRRIKALFVSTNDAEDEEDEYSADGM